MLVRPIQIPTETMSALAKKAHKRLDLLADATGRLAKAERLVRKWKKSPWLNVMQCADQLNKLLKHE
jgi:hypothetical protein